MDFAYLGGYSREAEFDDRVAQFNRWLRWVKAEVWSEAYQDGWSDRAHPGEDVQRNPYRADAAPTDEE
jgi:hypothetical protein